MCCKAVSPQYLTWPTDELLSSVSRTSQFTSQGHDDTAGASESMMFWAALCPARRWYQPRSSAEAIFLRHDLSVEGCLFDFLDLEL